MSNSKNESIKPIKGGTPSKQGFYSVVAQYTPEAIEFMVKTLRESRNENLRYAAAKWIGDKTIADVKALEITGADGEPFTISIKLDLSGGYVPHGRVSEMGTVDATQASSDTRPAQIQGSSLAPTGTQDNNSTNGIS